MNCCDDYGNCNQGRDCPCRKAIIDERNERCVSWINNKGLGMLIMIATSSTTVAIIVTGFYFFSK